ncbi:uncharacterized protein MONBRDRAFT_28596 [Monosiga brevicollis MX1]|uniref:Uncharacterized protein n=1 Tax=Monosiga brevicollis TaxID=81824 RepID=A9V8M6_MONBE|nr:uncharacterized protein MONBRDRAFT_28596 [Monosiga brevicollis MX1]EDQ86110.1 predicted protein [Monosiga brevicollis MX1]|eukprot:XP_001749035.1 hypothetical protein [Monosiga brevicollis MX1]
MQPREGQPTCRVNPIERIQWSSELQANHLFLAYTKSSVYVQLTRIFLECDRLSAFLTSDRYEWLVQQLDSNQVYFQSYSNAARRASEILAAIARMVNERAPTTRWEEVEHDFNGVWTTAHQLNNLKHALDQLPSMCRDIETLKNSIADLTEANQSRAAIIESHAATIAALTEDNQRRAATIADLTEANQSRAAIIESHAATIAALTEDNQRRAATIADLTEANQSRAAIIESHAATIAALTEDNQRRAATIADLTEDNQRHAATIAALTEANESHAAAIENLETLINIAEKYLAFVEHLQGQTSKTPGDFFSAMDALRLAGNQAAHPSEYDDKNLADLVKMLGDCFAAAPDTENSEVILCGLEAFDIAAQSQ